MQRKFIKNVLIVAGMMLFNIVSGNDNIGIEGETTCRSTITIHGSSNVNQFQFHNDNPIVTTASAENVYDNQVQIPVHTFEASNHRMLQDFHDMVNASEYPYINIEIESMQLADFDETSGMTNFRTKVSIAGKTNEYLVASEVAGCEHEGFILRGAMEVNLTDFDIEPPTKVFGAVRVNDKVLINFAFSLNHTEPATASAGDNN